jgi:hypothetical protein
MDQTQSDSQDEIWDGYLCHVCFQTILEETPPIENRCDIHQVGRCDECAKKYAGAKWCSHCARKQARGNYRIPSVGIGRFRRSAMEKAIGVLYFGQHDRSPSLALEMSSEGLYLVTFILSCVIYH